MSKATCHRRVPAGVKCSMGRCEVSRRSHLATSSPRPPVGLQGRSVSEAWDTSPGPDNLQETRPRRAMAGVCSSYRRRTEHASIRARHSCDDDDKSHWRKTHRADETPEPWPPGTRGMGGGERTPHRCWGTAARVPLGWRPGCSFFTFPPFANHPRVSILCLLVDDKFFFCQVGTCCSY